MSKNTPLSPPTLTIPQIPEELLATFPESAQVCIRLLLTALKESLDYQKLLESRIKELESRLAKVTIQATLL
jgi:hypothetical protein